MQAESLTSNKEKGPALSGVEGFTLLEVVVVGSIFTIGIIGVLGLISQSISFSSVTSERLIASYLAQEGVEIVQNIRDTNFIHIEADPGGPENWDDGLTGCTAATDGCEADYASVALIPVALLSPLNINSDNFYTYAAGTATRLKRKIEIQDASPVKKDVIVTVSWEGKGMGRVVLSSAIYEYGVSAPGYEYETQEITPFE